jgi:hypothetical protein
MVKYLPLILVFFIAVSSSPSQARALMANHVVISEIFSGYTGEANNEFVELYNPTESPIDLKGHRLVKLTASGTETVLIEDIDMVIGARGFLLFGHDDYTGSITPDKVYSSGAISSNNSIILDRGSINDLVDLVGMGSAGTFEGTAASNPASGKSLERKAHAEATAVSMTAGGTDEFLGNGYDTQNNAQDFVIRSLPEPQNSQSSTEPILTEPEPLPTPTPEPEVLPTPEPEPEITPIPSPTYPSVPLWSRAKFARINCEEVNLPGDALGRWRNFEQFMCHFRWE